MTVTPRSELKAVILAAGNGHRLVTREMGIPKPLCRVGEKPLIDHVVERFVSGGIGRFVLVLGYLASCVEEHVRKTWPQLTVETAFNPRFNEGNGLSVLAARPNAGSEFLLAMADHLFEPAALDRLVGNGPEPLGCALAVDRKLREVPDLKEATKAKLSGDRVIRVGKALTDFDAVDTGLFYAGSALMSALETSVAAGKTTLSDGVNVLAAAGRVRAVDVGPSRWLDVDTPEELLRAERLLLPNRAS